MLCTPGLPPLLSWLAMVPWDVSAGTLHSLSLKSPRLHYPSTLQVHGQSEKLEQRSLLRCMGLCKACPRGGQGDPPVQARVTSPQGAEVTVNWFSHYSVSPGSPIESGSKINCGVTKHDVRSLAQRTAFPEATPRKETFQATDGPPTHHRRR